MSDQIEPIAVVVTETTTTTTEVVKVTEVIVQEEPSVLDTINTGVMDAVLAVVSTIKGMLGK